MEGDCGVNAVTLAIVVSTQKGEGVTSLDGVNDHEFGGMLFSVGADEEGEFLRELPDGLVEVAVIEVGNR